MLRRIVPNAWHAVLLLMAPAGVPLADTLLVPDDFGTVQAALDAAEPGDVVLVEPGTYTENLTITVPVDLRGRETARTRLAPADEDLAAITIDRVAGVHLSNLTLIDATAGVEVLASTGIDITNVVFDRVAGTGLVADAASSVEAVNDVFFRNEIAIRRGTPDVEVVNNIFSGNGSTIVTALPLADPFTNVRANCFFENEDLQTNGDGALAGIGATVGNPRFVDPAERDFHLREDSVCIDAGRGIDVIDDTVADAGAYGGPFADPFPFPVGRPTLAPADTGGAAPPAIEASWSPNLDYRVTRSASPGGYRLYYTQGEAPERNVPSAYDGIDAGGGGEPSPIDVGEATSYTLEDLDPRAEPPLAPRSPSAAGRNESVVLSWEAVAGSDGYRVYYGVDDVRENRLDVGDGTRFTVTGLENGTSYRFAVGAVNEPRYHVAVAAYDGTQDRHESVLSPPASIAVGTAAESPLSQVRTATAGLVAPHPDLPDEGCFIASAAFGVEWAPEVQVLRAFRDRFLLPHAPGRWLVRRYYAASPPAARWLSEHAAARPAVRAALRPLVVLAAAMLEAPAALLVALAALGCGRAVWRACGRSTGRAPVRLPCRPRARLPCRPRARPRRRSRFRPLCRAITAVLAFSVLLAGAAVAGAQQRAALSSPRWMYEIKGGYLYPDLEQYARFYGDDRDAHFAIAGAFRFRDWLEAGGEIAYLRDRGAGLSASGAEVPEAVELTLLPVHAFVSFIFAAPQRRAVPYAGVGLGLAGYRQEIERQRDRDGRSDVGGSVRAGVRWPIGAQGTRTSGRDRLFWRSYVFFEVQRFSTEVDAVDLGGTSYRLGLRVELGR